MFPVQSRCHVETREAKLHACGYHQPLDPVRGRHAGEGTSDVVHGWDYLGLPAIAVQTSGKYPNAKILIEDAGSGTSLIQDLHAEGVPAQAIPSRGDKVVRMSAQTARIEGGRVHLPESASWLQDFRSEMTAFPYGRHDDQVDSL